MTGKPSWVGRCTTMVAAAALLLTASAPALAEKTGWRDPAHDMWSDVVEPGHANGDIRRVHVNHADRAVIIRVTYRDLRRRGYYLGLYGRVRTNTGAVNGFYFELGPDGDSGTWEEGRLELDWFGACGPDPQVGPSTVDYRLNVIELRIPRCELRQTRREAAPRWVKVQLHTSHAGGSGHYRDDGLTDNRSSRRWTPRIRHD